MSIINVGFTSSHWNRLNEKSSGKILELLEKAFDDGNATAVFHTYNVINAIIVDDIGAAKREAEQALHFAKYPDEEKRMVDCPFCRGEGVMEIEYTSNSDPDTTKTVNATCKACDGSGLLDVRDYFIEYAEETFPENAVVNILRGDLRSAMTIAKAVRSAVDQRQTSVEEDSLESHNFDWS